MRQILDIKITLLILGPLRKVSVKLKGVLRVIKFFGNQSVQVPGRNARTLMPKLKASLPDNLIHVGVNRIISCPALYNAL
jgi:hypothetical protein